MAEINNLQKEPDINFIRKIKECRRSCEHVMNDTQMILNRKITFPENMKQNIKIVGDVGQIKTLEVSLKEKLLAKTKPEVAQREKPQITPDTQQVLKPIQIDKNNEINNLQLLSEVKPGKTVDMTNPLDVVSVGDRSIILVDEKLNCLQRINTEGDVARRYQVTNKWVAYRSACVYGIYLFVATSDNVITKTSIDGSDGSIKYKPGRGIRIDSISAIGDNVILISNGGLAGLDGRILDYDIETNKVIQRLSGIGYPEKISVVQAGHHTKYIVKWYNLLSGERIVKIYNKDWNQISTININPDVLTVTPGGKLLLVNDNKIHEYSQDGTFIKGLLDKYKFKNIQDITWSGQCLWVLEASCIKIFVAN